MQASESSPLLQRVLPVNATREVYTKDGSCERLDYVLARQLADKDLVTDSDGNLYPLSVNHDELGKLGIGVGLYLKFVYYLIWVLAAMAVLALPTMISNATGDLAFNPANDIGFPRNIIVYFSLGNLNGRPMVLHAILDFVYSSVFIAFLVLFRRNQVRSRQEITIRNITAADYSVYVWGLPEDATDAREISEFFSQFGEVAKVSISVKTNELYQLHLEKERLTEDSEHHSIAQHQDKPGDARQKLAECTQKLSALETRSEKLSEEPVKSTGTVFVTFMLESSSIKCVTEYSNQRRVFGLFQANLPEHLRFRGDHVIHVRRAPQPSDVMWENLEFGFWSRFFRQTGTSLLSLFLVLLATSMIAAVNAKHFLWPVAHQNLFDQAWLNLGTVVVILFANIFLFLQIPVLARWEKFHFKSTLECHVMLRLFFFQVLNTMIGAGMLWDTSGRDWTHWYADGGYFIFNILIGDALLMNAIEFYRPFDILYRRRFASRKALTQTRLNKLYELPEYSLGMRYQFVLKAVFVGLMFSSGLPMNLFVATLSTALVYWIDKYNILRQYKKPTHYNDTVALVANVYVMPFAVVFHFVTSAYLYTVEAECLDTLVCWPTSNLAAVYVFIGIGLAVVLCVWQPLLVREPSVSYDLVRAREVPYNCVKEIASYQPPSMMRHVSGGAVASGLSNATSSDTQSASTLPRMTSRSSRNSTEEIDISVF